MSVVATGFARSAAPRRAARANVLWRELLAGLDRLVPPHDPAREPELPPERLKYPPI